MKSITVNTIVNAAPKKVWELWTSPKHIINWNFATHEWHCPNAKNDLKPGGTFSWRMEAKDGSMGFDYAGVYQRIDEQRIIEKKLDDGRTVTITFKQVEEGVEITETFEIEDENSAEMQRLGWQAILDKFKIYVEAP